MKNKTTNLILIIDDSLDSCALLSALFEAKGYEVICRSNGAEALVLLCELSKLPNIILLDAQMPIMDGYRFRVEQAKIDRIKRIPVVIMSGDDDLNMSEKMSHPYDVLVKPLRIQSLLASVQSCLQ